MYFDYRDCQLRTHLALQEIKKLAGIKAFIYARLRMAELYVMCKSDTIDYPDLHNFNAMVARLEIYVDKLKATKETFNKENFEETIGYESGNYFGDEEWFGIPTKDIENLTLYEFQKYIELLYTPEEELPMLDWEDNDWEEDDNDPWLW